MDMICFMYIKSENLYANFCYHDFKKDVYCCIPAKIKRSEIVKLGYDFWKIDRDMSYDIFFVGPNYSFPTTALRYKEMLDHPAIQVRDIKINHQLYHREAQDQDETRLSMVNSAEFIQYASITANNTLAIQFHHRNVNQEINLVPDGRFMYRENYFKYDARAVQNSLEYFPRNKMAFTGTLCWYDMNHHLEIHMITLHAPNGFQATINYKDCERDITYPYVVDFDGVFFSFIAREGEKFLIYRVHEGFSDFQFVAELKMHTKVSNNPGRLRYAGNLTSFFFDLFSEDRICLQVNTANAESFQLFKRHTYEVTAIYNRIRHISDRNTGVFKKVPFFSPLEGRLIALLNFFEILNDDIFEDLACNPSVFKLEGSDILE